MRQIRGRGDTRMSNRDHVLAFLRSIAPADASNSEIVARTGVTPHQQVFMITRDLRQLAQIKGVQAGHEWRFWYDGRERTNGPVSVHSGMRPLAAAHPNGTYDSGRADPPRSRSGLPPVRPAPAPPHP